MNKLLPILFLITVSFQLLAQETLSYNSKEGVLDNTVTAQDRTQALPAIKKQRIGFHSRTMKLEKFERK